MGQASGLTCRGGRRCGLSHSGQLCRCNGFKGLEGAIYGFLRRGCRCPLFRARAECQSFAVQVTSDAMDQRGTILPIAPDDVWPGIALLGLLLATGRIYWASTTIGKSGGAIPAFPAQRLFHRPGPISGPSGGRSAGPLPERASALARGHPLTQGVGNPAAPDWAGANAPAPGQAGAEGLPGLCPGGGAVCPNFPRGATGFAPVGRGPAPACAGAGWGQPCNVLTPISPSSRAFIAATAETAPAAVVK